MKKTTRKKRQLGWHFVGETLRDGRPIPPDGEWLEHEGSLVMCESGLHLSFKALHALTYAPGHTICRVEYGGKVLKDMDKLVCSRRKILWRFDGEKLLRDFARGCALDVIGLWEAPPIVRQYLETGDEAIKAAARDAAWAAAWAAARDAAGAAARAAARAAQNKRLEKMINEARP